MRKVWLLKNLINNIIWPILVNLILYTTKIIHKTFDTIVNPSSKFNIYFSFFFIFILSLSWWSCQSIIFIYFLFSHYIYFIISLQHIFFFIFSFRGTRFLALDIAFLVSIVWVKLSSPKIKKGESNREEKRDNEIKKDRL